MKWKKFRITTTTAAEDLVSGMLIELGIDGVQVEDNVQLSDKDRQCSLTFFLNFLLMRA